MSLDNIYNVFNLNWQSFNLDLNELKKVNSSKVDVIVKKSNESNWPIIPKGKYDNEFINIQKNDLRLSVEGIGKFRVLNGNEIIWCKENNLVKDQDIRNFLLGSSFGAALIQRGILVLHANALVKDHKCIICAGPSGSGKSTIAYSLINNGWKLITDDLVAINDDLHVLPGIKRIKLWEDTMNYFDLNINNFLNVRDGIKKYVLLENNANSFEEKIKIDSIYFIGKRIDDFEGSRITQLKSEQEKFVALIKNIYRPRFVKGLGEESKNFLKLSKISIMSKIFLLNLPNTLDKLQTFINSNF